MTDTTKRYRLLKDIPDAKAGTIFTSDNENHYDYENGMDNSYYHKDFVENNPEWFEEVLPVSEKVKEKIEVVDLYQLFKNPDTKGRHSYSIWTNSEMPKDKFPAIKVAIEVMLNNYFNAHIDNTWSIHSKNQKTYTQSEVDAIRADEFAKGYYSAKEEAMDYLNLNSNDTGKEDNETKSANWRSENLSKQSAPEPSALPNKEYEIVDYGYIQNNDNKPDQQYIHSVRRFHDNTLFQVGSQHFINGYMNTIKSFEVDKKYNTGKLLVHFIGLNIPYDLSELPPTPTQPVVEDKVVYAEIPFTDKTKPVLFTTTGDTVQVRDVNQNIYLVDKKTIVLSETNACSVANNFAYYGSIYLWFAEKSAAEQYILENKPCLSLNDVFQCSSWYAGNGVNKQNKFFKADLIKAVKQKLNK